jgi:hypothetical protein
VIADCAVHDAVAVRLYQACPSPQVGHVTQVVTAAMK